MRKTFLIAAYIFTALSVLFTFLRFDSLTFLPIVLATIFIVLTFIKSDVFQRKTPKYLFIITYLCAAVVIIQFLFFKNEVIKDTTFEQQKIESKQQAKQELDDLEKDLK